MFSIDLIIDAIIVSIGIAYVIWIVMNAIRDNPG